MKKIVYNGIEVVVLDKKETELVEFYEKNKNRQIQEIAKEEGATTYDCRKKMKEGERLKNA
jgi:hypothetical protein